MCAASGAAGIDAVSRIKDLLASLRNYDENGRNPAQKVAFQLPEKALNDYLAYTLRTNPRPGVDSVTLSLLPKNEVVAAVEVDFSAVREWNSQIIPEALRPLLSGRRALRIDFQFDVKDGRATFKVKDAQGPNGTAIANQILTELLRTLAGHQPEEFDAAKPIPLPYGLRRIWTEKQLAGGET